ncbi:ArnT family glycosyltransferase [Desulfomicrobium salsuginis]
MTADRSRLIPLLGVLIGLALLLYATLFAHRDVLGVDIMEARNLITAREMIETGHWFLPTLHGEPRLAKPPLPTWLTAAAMLTGNEGQDTDLSVNRIPSALAGLLLAVSLFGLTRHWTRSTAAAAWATAFLATSYMFVLMARRNSWDIYCHAFMLAALWGVAVIVDSPVPRRKLTAGTGLLLGLSGLSKGPVSFYALLLPFAVSILSTGGWKGVRAHGKELGLALGIGIALSSVWFAAAWLAMPHDFSRMVATEQAAWLVEHTKPFWFYLQFPLMTGIWVLLACAALWPGHARPLIDPLLPYWRPVMWSLGCVLLLMIVPEKKDRYLLPVLVPLCQLMGVYVTGLLRDTHKGGRLGRVLVHANAALFGLVCLAVPMALIWLRPRFPALDGLELAAVTLAAVLAAALLYRLCRSQHLTALFMAEFSILGMCGLALPALVQPAAGDMSMPLAEIRSFTADGPVFSDRSLKFQDAWVIGKKPLEPDECSSIELPDKIYFVSRRDNPALPDMLQGYEPMERLAVSDFSGQNMYFVTLKRHNTE